MYVYVCVCVCVFVCCMYVYVYVCVYMYVYMCVYVCMYYVCMDICTCMYVLKLYLAMECNIGLCMRIDVLEFFLEGRPSESTGIEILVFVIVNMLQNTVSITRVCYYLLQFF